MEQLSGLLKEIHKYNSKYKITDRSSEAEKLRFELMQKNLSADECLELQRKVKFFLESDASEKDKQMVTGYTESLYMLCSAIKDNLL